MAYRYFKNQPWLITLIVLLSLSTPVPAAEKCPVIDRSNIRAHWEAINADDLRYFYLDLSSLDTGLLAMGFWYDTAMVSLFRLTSYQISRGSVVLLFESMERNSTDRLVISGKGRVCDSSGVIEAEVQLLMHRSAISRKLSLVFRKNVAKRPSALDLLETVSSACRKKIHNPTNR